MRHTITITHTYIINPFREAALNDLEAYIYKVKNRLSEDEDALKEVKIGRASCRERVCYAV